jgi:hypothetical protein
MAPTDFRKLAAHWQFPPFVANQELHPEGINMCAAGARRNRPVAVAVSTASRLVERRTVRRTGGHHLVVTMARLGVPPEWIP